MLVVGGGRQWVAVGGSGAFLGRPSGQRRRRLRQRPRQRRRRTLLTEKPAQRFWGLQGEVGGWVVQWVPQWVGGGH